MKVKVKNSVIFVTLFLAFLATVEGKAKRAPECNDEQHKEMTEKFQECLKKYTDEHHEASGKATKPEEYQKFTCKLLSDTVECGELWKRCNSLSEVRSIQDNHIQARIQQFRDNKDGIDVLKCPVAKEYIESGRGDQIDQSTEGACSVSEVSDIQREFQACSHEKSLKLYEAIQELEEGRYSRDTNDLPSDPNDPADASLDPVKDIRPKVCEALKAIAKDCIESINKCFSKEDSDQIKRQHIEQMQKYYAKIYEGVGDLQSCPGMELLEEEEVDDDYNEVNDEYEYEEYEDEVLEDPEDPEPSMPSSSSTEDYRRSRIGTSQAFEDDFEANSPLPDPEGNAVIAEPPSSYNVIDASRGRSVVPGLILMALCLITLFGHYRENLF